MVLPICDKMDVVYDNYGIHETNDESNKIGKIQNICISYKIIINKNLFERITPYSKELRLLKLFKLWINKIK